MSDSGSVSGKVGAALDDGTSGQTGKNDFNRARSERRRDILGRGVGLVRNLIEQGLFINSP